MPLTADEVLRDYVTEGVPSSGPHEPKKSELRTLLGGYEQVINSFLASGGRVYISKTELTADLAHAAKTMAWVIGDATAANNGIYQKQGASGAGSWTRVADLPYSFIVASDVGDGTPDAIVATTSLPVSGSALVLLNIFEENTGSPVTVSFNGGAPLTIKTNSGNDVAAGGLQSGMLVMGRVSGATFRIVSDQVSSAIIAQAEAAATQAESFRDQAAGYAAIAIKNWFPDDFVGDGTSDPLTLTADPGSVYNCIITIEGQGPQPSGIFTLNGTDLYPPDGAVWPDGKKIEVRYGTAFDAGVPSPGSVDRTAMANDAVGPDELDADAVQAQHIDAAEASGIRDKLGLGAGDAPEFAGLTIDSVPIGSLASGKVKQFKLLSGTGTPSNNTTTVAQMGTAFSIDRVSTTSKLCVVVFLAAFMSSTSSDDVGAELDVRFYNGTSYATAPSGMAAVDLSSFDTGGTPSRGFRQAATLLIGLTQAHIRSDQAGRWTVAIHGKCKFGSNTLLLNAHSAIAIEYED